MGAGVGAAAGVRQLGQAADGRLLAGPPQVEQVGHNFFIFRDLESSQVQA